MLAAEMGKVGKIEENVKLNLREWVRQELNQYNKQGHPCPEALQ